MHKDGKNTGLNVFGYIQLNDHGHKHYYFVPGEMNVLINQITNVLFRLFENLKKLIMHPMGFFF